jgi:hypothetical protein
VPIQELTISLCNQLALVHPEDGGDTILWNIGSYKSHTGSISQKMIIIKQNPVNCTLQNSDIVTDSPLHPLSNTGIFRPVFVEDTFSRQVHLNALQNDFVSFLMELISVRRGCNEMVQRLFERNIWKRMLSKQISSCWRFWVATIVTRFKCMWLSSMGISWGYSVHQLAWHNWWFERGKSGKVVHNLCRKFTSCTLEFHHLFNITITGRRTHQTCFTSRIVVPVCTAFYGEK